MSEPNGAALAELDIERPSRPAPPPPTVDDRLDALANAYGELNRAFGQLRAYTLDLGKQQDYADRQMERNARATALDLAIKAAPEAAKGDADLVTALAGGFLVWLKGGEPT